MSARTTFAGMTDAGLSRSHNEDAFVAKPPLFVVADGLGGHKAGEVASGIAVDVIESEAPREPDAEALARAVSAANAAVIGAVAEGRGRQGMGTTVTAAVLGRQQAVVAHVGDSRAYLLRDRTLTRVTRDHSLVGEMVRQGTLSENEARSHPNRSVVTRALGSRHDVEADTFTFEIAPGDRLLLCSDGLHGMIEDEEIQALLSAAPDAESAVRELVAAANDAGGMDNVTVVVVDVPTTPTGRGGSARRRILAVLAWLLAALLAVGAVAGGTYAYARSRAFLVVEDGTIVVYRGIQGGFAGIELSWLEQKTGIEADRLPEVTAHRLSEGVAADDVEHAMSLVATYRDLLGPETTTTPEP